MSEAFAPGACRATGFTALPGTARKSKVIVIADGVFQFCLVPI